MNVYQHVLLELNTVYMLQYQIKQIINEKYNSNMFNVKNTLNISTN